MEKLHIIKIHKVSVFGVIVCLSVWYRLDSKWLTVRCSSIHGLEVIVNRVGKFLKGLITWREWFSTVTHIRRNNTKPFKPFFFTTALLLQNYIPHLITWLIWHSQPHTTWHMEYVFTHDLHSVWVYMKQANHMHAHEEWLSVATKWDASFSVIFWCKCAFTGYCGLSLWVWKLVPSLCNNATLCPGFLLSLVPSYYST